MGPNRGRNIYEISRPFYWIARVLGFAPYRVVGPATDGVIETNICDLIPFMILLCAQCYLIYFNFKYNLNISYTTSAIVNLGNRIVLIIGMIDVFFASISTFVFRKRIWKLIHTIYKCDLMLEKLQCGVNQTREFVESASILICASLNFMMAFSCTCYILATLDNINYRVHLFFTYIFANGSYAVLMFHFINITQRIGARFEQLNECLRKYFPINDGQSQPASTGTAAMLFVISNYELDHKTIVFQLAEIHDRLIVASENLSFCFSIQMMSAILNGLIFGVFSYFQLYLSVIYAENNILLVMNNILWSLFFTIFIFTLVAMTCATTKKGRHTATLIHKTINSSDDDELKKALLLFSQQIEHQRPDITCGLFSYNWTLLYSMVGAFATYLVIMIQFDEASSRRI